MKVRVGRIARLLTLPSPKRGRGRIEQFPLRFFRIGVRHHRGTPFRAHRRQSSDGGSAQSGKRHSKRSEMEADLTPIEKISRVDNRLRGSCRGEQPHLSSLHPSPRGNPFRCGRLGHPARHATRSVATPPWAEHFRVGDKR